MIVFVVPGVGHLTDLVLPREGIFDCRLGRKRLRPNICSRFHASRMRARSGKSAISTQSSSAHVEERDQELLGTLEQDLSLIGFSKKQ